MQKSLVTAAITATLFCVASANAADLPTKAPAYKAPPPLASDNWTGLDLGINGGGAWGREDWLDNVGAGGCVPENFRPNGGVFGGQVGFRWQWNQLVLGIEGTWDWAGLRDTLAPGAGPRNSRLPLSTRQPVRLDGLPGIISWSMSKAAGQAPRPKPTSISMAT
jgi:opacity protein-like surface antigen